MELICIIMGCFVLAGVVMLITYGIDKHKAKKGKWRILKQSLLLVAAFCGSMGVWLGVLLQIVLAIWFVKHFVL